MFPTQIYCHGLLRLLQRKPPKSRRQSHHRRAAISQQQRFWIQLTAKSRIVSVKDFDQMGIASQAVVSHQETLPPT